MSTLLPFAHAWMWLGLAVSTPTPPIPATPASDHAASVQVRGTYGNHGIWISSAGADARASDGFAPLREEPRVEKADYVVVDLRGDSAGLAQASPAVIEQLWGPTQAASSRPRLKGNARAYVIADGGCRSSCEQAVALWKAHGAVRLQVPRALAAQDDIALEAWVLATANNPPAAHNVAAQVKASP